MIEKDLNPWQDDVAGNARKVLVKKTQKYTFSDARRDPNAADDLAHDALLEHLREGLRICNPRDEGASVLARRAREIRKNQYKNSQIDQDADSSGQNLSGMDEGYAVAEEAEIEKRASLVKNALQTLSADKRAVLLLRLADADYTLKKLANMANVSPELIRVFQEKALQALRLHVPHSKNQSLLSSMRAYIEINPIDVLYEAGVLKNRKKFVPKKSISPEEEAEKLSALDGWLQKHAEFSEVLDNLPQIQRQIIRYRLAGFSYGQMYGELNISIVEGREHLTRALAVFKKKFGEGVSWSILKSGSPSEIRLLEIENQLK
jgi:RNA polymerase sigma factor (sigma-70 family)